MRIQSLHAHLESDSLTAVNCSGGSGPSSSARCKTVVTLERLSSCSYGFKRAKHWSAHRTILQLSLPDCIGETPLHLLLCYKQSLSTQINTT